MLQCVAVCCSVLKFVAMCCSESQCATVQNAKGSKREYSGTGRPKQQHKTPQERTRGMQELCDVVEYFYVMSLSISNVISLSISM